MAYADSVTGQAFRVKAVPTTATALVVPVVEKEELTKKDSDLNQYHLSGKQLGAMVGFMEGEELTIAIAKGNLPEDGWSILATDVAVIPA